MSAAAGSVGRVSGVAAAALALLFGGLPANADAANAGSNAGASNARSNPWAALERPETALLSGVQGCGQAFEDGLSTGSRCLLDRAANGLLLGALTRFAAERGRRAFGAHFRIVSDLHYSPYGSGLRGGLDVVLPLLPARGAGAAPSASHALFLQQGVTRWVDGRGSARNDIRIGAVRRFGLSEAGPASDVVGLSAFVQQSLEFRHTRLVAGADYAGRWGRGSLNLFVPTTGWTPAHEGHEERALAGFELDLRFDLTGTLSMRTALGRWEDGDGLGGWSTNGRLAVGWRPHPWLDLGVMWNGPGADRDALAFRVAFSMPLGDPRRPPRWQGLGLAGGGPKPTALDTWRPVDNVGVLQVARRERTPERLVAQATVRFLQARANSGDEIGLEVRFPDPAPRDIDLAIVLAPGAGDNPAVPGVDFIDAPVPVTVYAGTSRSVVAVRLPLNAALKENRSLSATVTLAP